MMIYLLTPNHNKEIPFWGSISQEENPNKNTMIWMVGKLFHTCKITSLNSKFSAVKSIKICSNGILVTRSGKTFFFISKKKADQNNSYLLVNYQNS